MAAIHDLELFVVSCLLLNITPGQDTLYILGRSIAQGRAAGFVSVAGIMTGVFIHTWLAAIGLSALLATSAMAFHLVKAAGAAYLIWLGCSFLRRSAGNKTPDPAVLSVENPWRIYRQGIVTNLLNPKVALFFLSFLPQFVDPGSGRAVVSFVVLGMVFFTTGTVWCLLLVYASSWMFKKIASRSAGVRGLRRLTGLLFVGLGIKLALTSG
jgi:threonine/homoserine/homoserine lactone efflux protein